MAAGAGTPGGRGQRLPEREGVDARDAGEIERQHGAVRHDHEIARAFRGLARECRGEAGVSGIGGLVAEHQFKRAEMAHDEITHDADPQAITAATRDAAE